MESQPLNEPLAEKAKTGPSRSRQLLRVLLYLEFLIVILGYDLDRSARTATNEIYDFYPSDLDNGEEYGPVTRSRVRTKVLERKGVQLNNGDGDNVDQYSRRSIINNCQFEITYTPKSPVLAAGCVGLGAIASQAGVLFGMPPVIVAADPGSRDLVVCEIKLNSISRFELPFWNEFSWLETIGMGLLLAVTGALIILALASLLRYLNILFQYIPRDPFYYFVAGLAALVVFLVRRSW